MFIIDFDDTLFDTQAFKQVRLLAVQVTGVSEEEFWETYRQARNSPDGLFTYSNERHARILAERGYDEQEVLAALASTTGGGLKDFLFPDAMVFLQRMKAYGEPMILLSLGNPGFQELKTKGSGVDIFFDRIFMVHDTKAHVLQELFKTVGGDAVWFINDKVEETKKLCAMFPQLEPLLKISERYERKEYAESGFPHFETLTEIGSFILERRQQSPKEDA